jgi:hypothetical protein
MEKIVASVEQKSACARLGMSGCHYTAEMVVDLEHRGIAEVGAAVGGEMIDDRVALVFLKIDSVARICDTYGLYLFVFALCGVYRCVEEIKTVVLDYRRTRPTAIVVIFLVGIKRYGKLLPMKKILCASMSPMHWLLPRHFIVGCVLIEYVIISVEIYKAVGVIYPTALGLIVIFKRL